MDYNRKNVLVVGAARSGISAAKLLNRLGANVTLADSKPREKLQEAVSELEGEGVGLCLGHNANKETIKKQSLVVSSPGIPNEMETFEIARREGVPIMGEMELAFTLCPCPVAAITGTNGKTTVTALAGAIIAKHIENTAVAGNIGVPFTESVLTLDKNAFAVVEASSFQLENITVFKPKISALLNVTPDHLDRHKTFERYLKAKTNVYKYTDKSCTVILNYDEPILRELPVNTGARVLYFSAESELNEGAYLKNEEIILKYDDAEQTLIPIDKLKIPGEHNVRNALAASLIGACAGVPANVIGTSIAEFTGVCHRLEFVRELNNVKFYNDSKATNPEASETALDALSGKTVLIAGGFNKGADFDGLAQLFERKLSFLIAIGETKERIIGACDRAGFKRYTTAKDYPQAVALAAEIASHGENVLLSPACASWDMFSNFEERGDYFKKLVNNL